MKRLLLIAVVVGIIYKPCGSVIYFLKKTNDGIYMTGYFLKYCEAKLGHKGGHKFR